MDEFWYTHSRVNWLGTCKLSTSYPPLDSRFCDWKQNRSSISWSLCFLVRPLFSSPALIPWQLIDLDEFWYTHSRVDWLSTCKFSTSYALLDSRFCYWKQSRSSISWSLCFLVRPLFSSLALIPWQLINLDEIWHTHSRVDWLSTCKLSTSYAPPDSRFCDWKQNRSSISGSLCFLVGPLFSLLALIPWQLIYLDELWHTHSRGDWLITCKLSRSFALLDSRFWEWKQSWLSSSWSFCFLVWPLFSSLALVPWQLIDLDEIRHTHTTVDWLSTCKFSTSYALLDSRFCYWKQSRSSISWSLCFSVRPLFSSLALIPWQLSDSDGIGHKYSRGDWLITCKLSRSYALLDSRIWEWKQSCSSCSWSLCFLVWPLFSSLALIPWQLIDLDEIWHTHSRVDSLSTCKLSTSYPPLDSRFCDWKQSTSSISWSLCYLVRPLFSSLALIPWQLIDLDEFWHTHSRGGWLTTCKLSTSYPPLDSRFCDWKQNRSSISWSLCFLVRPLFSSPALIPWQLIDLDEFWYTHSRVDWLSTCKFSTSYALLDSRFCYWKQSRSSISWSLCFLFRPLFSSLALIPWQLIDLDEIWHTHSRVDWLSTCKLSTSYAPPDSRFCDWKQNRSSISGSLCFLVGPLFSLLALIPWQLIDLDELWHTHSRGDWLITCKLSRSYALLDSRFWEWKQSWLSSSWSFCFLVWPLFSSLALVPWQLIDLDEIRHTHTTVDWLSTCKFSTSYALLDSRFCYWKQSRSSISWSLCFSVRPLFSSLALIPWQLSDSDGIGHKYSSGDWLITCKLSRSDALLDSRFWEWKQSCSSCSWSLCFLVWPLFSLLALIPWQLIDLDEVWHTHSRVDLLSTCKLSTSYPPLDSRFCDWKQSRSSISWSLCFLVWPLFSSLALIPWQLIDLDEVWHTHSRVDRLSTCKLSTSYPPLDSRFCDWKQNRSSISKFVLFGSTTFFLASPYTLTVDRFGWIFAHT